MSRHFEQLTPQSFSFNSPLGWCPACQGLGTEQGANLSALIPNPDLSLAEGAVAAWPNPQSHPLFARMLDALAREFAMPLDVPFRRLDPKHQRIVLQGAGDRWISCEAPPIIPPADATPAPSDKARRRSRAAAPEPVGLGAPLRFQYKGLYPAIDEARRISFEYRQELQDLSGETVCSMCHGGRIGDVAAAVRLRGQTLPQVCQAPLHETVAFLEGLQLSPEERKIAGDLLDEVLHRLRFLIEVGLEYLTLDRPMPSLSGGESQRIRLAGQIGRALTGVLYVLDEPTIGLHPRDNARLIQALHKLRDIGNTLVLVEHDREVLESADRLVDFGPGSGRHGGEVVAQGTPEEFAAGGELQSLTAQYLSGRKQIPIPAVRRMRPQAPPDSGTPAAPASPEGAARGRRPPTTRSRPRKSP